MHDADLDDDGGISGWEQGDAEHQLIPGEGVTITDAGLAKFARVALVIGLILVVAYMARR